MGYTPNAMTPLDFVDKVRSAAMLYGMFTAGDRVLAAVSGGADSVALLQVLRMLAPELHLHLEAAHLNHNLRAQARRDADFVRGLAADMGIACHIGEADVAALGREAGLCLEEAGRRARYTFLEDLARRHGFTRIAMGHHMDDNAEQLLMALLRGSGLLGLSGMPAVRRDRFVRPLIDVTRADILRFLAELGCGFVTDDSNLDLRFVRNRVRHGLLPMLKSTFNPRVVESLHRTCRMLADEEDWARQRTAALFETVAVRRRRGGLLLAGTPLQAMHVAARRRVVRMALENVRGNLRRIGFSHVQQILALLDDGAPGTRVHLPGGVVVWRRRHDLIFRSSPAAHGRPCDNTAEVSDFSYRLTGFGRLRIAETRAELRFSPLPLEQVPEGYGTGQREAFFDIDSLKFPLVVRNIRPGDRFVPLGMQGSKKVARFFNDCKIPVQRRRSVPLVVSGGRIVWVAGYRIDQRARLVSGSRGAVRGELVLA